MNFHWEKKQNSEFQKSNGNAIVSDGNAIRLNGIAIVLNGNVTKSFRPSFVMYGKYFVLNASAQSTDGSANNLNVFSILKCGIATKPDDYSLTIDGNSTSTYSFATKSVSQSIRSTWKSFSRTGRSFRNV